MNGPLTQIRLYLNTMFDPTRCQGMSLKQRHQCSLGRAKYGVLKVDMRANQMFDLINAFNYPLSYNQVSEFKNWCYHNPLLIGKDSGINIKTFNDLLLKQVNQSHAYRSVTLMYDNITELLLDQPSLKSSMIYVDELLDQLQLQYQS